MKATNQHPHLSFSQGSVCLLLCMVLGGCAPMISARVMKPAEVNVSAYHNVAVADFDGQHGNDISRWIEQALTQVRHDGEPYFKLVARDQLQKVMKEQSLQLTGAIDQSQVSQVGKVLGVEAIIIGNVSNYRVQDANFTETRTVGYKCGNETCSREVEIPCLQREAYVLFNVNFLGVQTGAIETSDSEETQLIAKQCKGDSESIAAAIVGALRDHAPMQSPERMLKQAADQGIAKFVAKITPHYVVQTVSLKKEQDDAPWFFYSDEERALSDKMKGGVEYAKSGVWQQAIGSWEEAVKQAPNCAACHYNLGFGYEMRGQLEKAKELYEKAAQLRPGESDYTRAVGRIQVRINDAETLKGQLKGRGRNKR